MNNTTVKSFSLDTEIMIKAERILESEGTNIEESINAMLRSIAETGFCPFVGTKERRMIDPDTMTDEEIAAEVQKGIDDIENGRVVTLEESRAHIERLHKAWESIL